MKQLDRMDYLGFIARITSPLSHPLEGDSKTMFSFCTDDVISMPNFGPMIEGIEALKKNDEEMRKVGFKIQI